MAGTKLERTQKSITVVEPLQEHVANEILDVFPETLDDTGSESILVVPEAEPQLTPSLRQPSPQTRQM
jgi:DNA-directed RNA polymerase subunit F